MRLRGRMILGVETNPAPRARTMQGRYCVVKDQVRDFQEKTGIDRADPLSSSVATPKTQDDRILHIARGGLVVEESHGFASPALSQ